MSNALTCPRCEGAKETTMRALLLLMSTISEECYCAGWVHGLEYALWDAMQESPRSFGQGEITEANVTDLRTLSELAGGWWVWCEEDPSEVFVTLAWMRARDEALKK